MQLGILGTPLFCTEVLLYLLLSRNWCSLFTKIPKNTFSSIFSNKIKGTLSCWKNSLLLEWSAILSNEPAHLNQTSPHLLADLVLCMEYQWALVQIFSWPFGWNHWPPAIGAPHRRRRSLVRLGITTYLTLKVLPPALRITVHTVKVLLHLLLRCLWIPWSAPVFHVIVDIAFTFQHMSTC